jgi:hypothetical protein
VLPDDLFYNQQTILPLVLFASDLTDD